MGAVWVRGLADVLVVVVVVQRGGQDPPAGAAGAREEGAGGGGSWGGGWGEAVRVGGGWGVGMCNYRCSGCRGAVEAEGRIFGTLLVYENIGFMGVDFLDHWKEGWTEGVLTNTFVHIAQRFYSTFLC